MSEYTRRPGDRKDGRLLRTLPAFNKFVPYIMPQRNDRFVHYEEAFEVTAVDRRLRQLRTEGYKGLGMLHFLVATYVRTASMLPGINRFVAGRRIYAHKDIEVVMTVKRELTIDATETTIKVRFQPTDTIFDVYRKMNEKISEIKDSDDNNGTEDFAEVAASLPRFLLRAAIGVLRIMDYFGWLPEKLTDVSPFHGSMIAAHRPRLSPHLQLRHPAGVHRLRRQAPRLRDQPPRQGDRQQVRRHQDGHRRGHCGRPLLRAAPARLPLHVRASRDPRDPAHQGRRRHPVIQFLVFSA